MKRLNELLNESDGKKTSGTIKLIVSEKEFDDEAQLEEYIKSTLMNGPAKISKVEINLSALS